MMPLLPEILYEDENLLVINKPAGLVVHADGRGDEPTLVDWLVAKYPEIKDVGEPPINLKASSSKPQAILRSGIVHRLDKGTSGAMVVAKNQPTFEFLKKQFQSRKVQKNYHALVWGNFKEDSGVIDKPIGRSKKDFRKKTSLKDATGEMREAVTEWRVLKRARDFTLIEARPKTGRTHQIRVHMKAINHPIVGDELYGPGRPTPKGLGRPALHSYSIKFTDMDGKEISVVAPYPEDFSQIVGNL